MNNFESAKNAIVGASNQELRILAPDRIEALRTGGSNWEREYWEGVEMDQIDRHRLGNLALRPTVKQLESLNPPHLP